MPSKRFTHVVSILLFLFFCICPSVFAAFNLIATPNDGGFDLRFNRVSPNDFKAAKEVTLRITSDIAKPYRVFQKVIVPLATSDGTPLPDEQFKMYPLVNSNSRGTLLYREESPVNQFNELIYTSDGAGTSDSFQLVYTITPKGNQIQGSYYGRFSYVLVPVDTTQVQVVTNMNVYVELAAGTTPVVEVKTESGIPRLELSSKKIAFNKEINLAQLPQVEVKIHGPVGMLYRIYQSLEGGEVKSGAGDEFDLSHLLFSIDGKKNGTTVSGGTLAAAANKQLLYTSDSNGSGDEFVITYKPDKDFRLETADRYSGRMNFIMETDQPVSFKTGILGTLDVELDIAPVFDIYVFSQEKEGVNLSFGNVTYRTGPKTSEIEIFVETNMHKSYQVIQKVGGPMLNENNDIVPSEDFVVQVKDLKTEEDPLSYLKDTTPVKEGDTVLFSSGSSGKSAQFKIDYRLTMRPDSKAGNYTTRIGYSLSLN